MGPPHPPPHHYEPDAALRRRMLFTMLLAAGVYAAAVSPFFLLGGPLWGLAAAVAAVVSAVAVCRWADRFALWAADAREVDAAAEPELHAVVERLCVSADLPKPRVAVAATPLPNAFAAGAGPGSAVVCVTEGLRGALGPAELTAVLGHELAHVRNRDVLVSSVAAFPAMVAAWFLVFWAGLLRGPLGVVAALLLVPLALAAVLLWVLGTVVGLALSRHRELCADTTGTLLTGRPGELASALVRIREAVAAAGPADRRALRAVSGLCAVPVPGRGRDPRDLLSTHPTLERRTARLTLVAQRLAAGER